MTDGSSVAPTLIVITDTTVAPEGFVEERVERVLSLARPGTVMVMLRELEMPFRARRALGERLAALCHVHHAWFSVNDRLDLAVLLGADGLHLGERSLPPLDARALLPRTTFISHACHDVAAVHDGASNAALLSPIFAPRKGRPPLGVAAVRDARALLDTKTSGAALYALGGVSGSNAAECLDAGATGVAVIGAVLDGRDPTALIRALRLER